MAEVQSALAVAVPNSMATAAIRLCDRCGEPIPLARLKAKPGATQCVPCLTATGDVARYHERPTPLVSVQPIDTDVDDEKGRQNVTELATTVTGFHEMELWTGYERPRSTVQPELWIGYEPADFNFENRMIKKMDAARKRGNREFVRQCRTRSLQ